MTPTPRPKALKFPRFLRGTIELTALTLGVFLVTLWIIARRAEAKLVEAAEHLLPAAFATELERSETTRAPFGGVLYLNGLPLRIETRNLPGAPSEQVSVIQKQCTGFSFEGKETTGLGRSVVCLRAPLGKTPELAASIERYAATSDLKELGSPEIHFLRPTTRKGQSMTQLLQVRALSLDLHSAFPTEGDAPGLDPTFAPRPAGRRILSVQVHEGAEENVMRRRARAREVLFAYESATTPEKALLDYERVLVQKGFRALPTGETGPFARAFESKEDAFLILTGPEGQGSWLSLALLPKTGQPRSATEGTPSLARTTALQ